MTFESNFKTPKSGKVARFQKRMAAKRLEDAEKGKVRKRDRHCRFPLCGCRRFGLSLHVSHKGGPDSHHKGMGGNPAGDRSDASTMVLVCSARHRENRVAIDRGALRWRPMTADGANGPIAWDLAGGKWFMPDVDTGLLSSEWFELARERRPGILEPLTIYQRQVLTFLAEMIPGT